MFARYNNLLDKLEEKPIEVDSSDEILQKLNDYFKKTNEEEKYADALMAYLDNESEKDKPLKVTPQIKSIDKTDDIKSNINNNKEESKKMEKYNFNKEESDREKKNKNLALDVAIESIVLLENKDNILPLKTKDIALYGGGAKYTSTGGTGSGEVNSRHNVSIYEGLKNYGFNITTEDTLNRYDAKYKKSLEDYRESIKENFKKLSVGKIVNQIFDFPKLPEMDISSSDIKNTDTCIYVLDRSTTENTDVKPIKGEYYLSDNEKDNLRLLNKNYKNVIVIINSGYPVDMNFIDSLENVKGTIFSGYAGMMSGYAISSLITGKENFSGKLANTWPREYKDIPNSSDFGEIKDNIDYKDDILVGYKYYDSYKVKPRFRFGYGLSYTNFNTKINSITKDNSKITIDMQVKNVGSNPGKDTLEAYIDAPEGKLKKERQKLVGYTKTDKLNIGESKNYKITFDLKDYASYDESTKSYILEKGIYKIRLGNNELFDIGDIDLRDDIITKKVEGLDAKDIDTIDIPKKTNLRNKKLPLIVMDKSDFKTETIDYSDDGIKFNLVKKSIPGMINTVVGEGLTSISYPGNVGGIKVNDKYFPNLKSQKLSDGPSGLRLTQKSNIGKINRMVTGPVKALDYFPDWMKNIMFGKEGENTSYIYATKFPSPMNMAQTFNDDLVKKVGMAMGEEMKEFNIETLLAPAVNIVRNPLGGRTFEYFSEDPTISGNMGANIIEGVNSENMEATIKHFCCNNQENNREHYSSNVSERALREVYLKPFEIAIKKTKENAKENKTIPRLNVMTSYNKVNGVYTSSSKLIKKFLRGELGFHGLVMTDWYSTGLGKGDAYKAIKSENDIIMPGTIIDKINILLNLMKGNLTKEELTNSYSRIISYLNSKEFNDLPSNDKEEILNEVKDTIKDEKILK